MEWFEWRVNASLILRALGHARWTAGIRPIAQGTGRFCRENAEHAPSGEPNPPRGSRSLELGGTRAIGFCFTLAWIACAC